MNANGLVAASLLAIALAGCHKDNGKTIDLSKATKAAGVTKNAMLSPNEAPLVDAKGEQIGSVKATEDEKGSALSIMVTTKDKMPSGELGVTINDKGSCEGDNFAGSGAHWGAGGHQHGVNNLKGFHLGDIGNAYSNVGTGMTFTYGTTLSAIGYRKKLLRGNLFGPGGFSVVIHEHKDDMKTDPDGGMGKGLACAAFHG